ncbi:sensor histidine kinase [Flammeovirgaceae bacterium SG7u.111]|nr:sensor histidine kinase [Flammeovirgaceae bacterium SG7u.132]WPO37355.1 sensor histidine kinase [Flammeovirgaceae bacterium SG7u.111]
MVHLYFWIAFLALFTFFWSGRLTLEEALLRGTVLTLFQMILVYTNLAFLMPKFYERQKYGLFIISSILLILILFLLFNFADFQVAKWVFDIPDRPLRGPKGGEREAVDALNSFARKRGNDMFKMAMRTRSLFNVSLFVSLFVISVAYRLSQIAAKKEKEAVLLRNEKLDAEMKFLKSQINPHFLFNALNNAYTLSYIKSDDAPDVILKLSDILRYIIYDCNADKVPLEKEVTYIKNYIDLQKIKGENSENIKATFKLQDTSLMIEPMLLIPFIENSFKHSHIESSDKGWVDMVLKVTSEKLEFEIKNSLPETEFTKDKVGGIGLENVKKRLSMLYPDSHQLVIKKMDGQFSVSMQIRF